MVRQAVRRTDRRGEDHGAEERLLLPLRGGERGGPRPDPFDDRPCGGHRGGRALRGDRPRRGERRRTDRHRLPAHRRWQGLRRPAGMVHQHARPDRPGGAAGRGLNATAVVPGRRHAFLADGARSRPARGPANVPACRRAPRCHWELRGRQQGAPRPASAARTAVEGTPAGAYPDRVSVLPDPTDVTGLDHWRTLDAKQQPQWPDSELLEDSTRRLADVPPLVFAGEADRLRAHLAAAGRGEAFLLQGGDCAETFAELTADSPRDKIKMILQMAVVLTYGASMPVIKMGRMAGQYAKPRSKDTETRDGV